MSINHTGSKTSMEQHLMLHKEIMITACSNSNNNREGKVSKRVLTCTTRKRDSTNTIITITISNSSSTIKVWEKKQAGKRHMQISSLHSQINMGMKVQAYIKRMKNHQCISLPLRLG